MKSGLIFKGLLLTILVAAIGISLKVFNDNQAKDAEIADSCQKRKLLTKVDVKKYDRNGVNEDEETFYKQVSFKTKPLIPVVISPEALDVNKWAKVPQSAIKYIGKEDKWFSPDRFYLLQVPSVAKGLALGKPCYGEGNVMVYPIRNWKQVENKISINSEITLEPTTPLPKTNPAHILVNVGSNKQDSLGDKTEVYFIKERLRIPEKK